MIPSLEPPGSESLRTPSNGPPRPVDGESGAAVRRILKQLPRLAEADREEWLRRLGELLETRDDGALRAVLSWMAEGHDELPAWLAEELACHGFTPPGATADDPDPERRAAAVIALLNSWDVGDAREGFRIVDSLLRGTGEQRRVGIRVLGGGHREQYAWLLVRYLRDPEPETRAAAAAALRRLVTAASAPLVADLLAAMEWADAGAREHLLESLGRIEDPACVGPLLEMADRLAPATLTSAEATLVRIGRLAIPALVAGVRAPGLGFAGRRLAAGALATISPRHLHAISDAVIEAELGRAQRCRAAAPALARAAGGSAGAIVLKGYYRDAIAEVIAFTLDILSLAGRLPERAAVDTALAVRDAEVPLSAAHILKRRIGRRSAATILSLLDTRGAGGAPPREAPVDAGEIGVIAAAALENPHAGEAAAGAQVLFEVDGHDSLVRLRAAFSRHDSPLVRETIVELARRAAGRPAGQTPIETLAALRRADFFASFPIADLEALLRFAVPERVRSRRWIYREGDPAEDCFLVMEGSVELHTSQGTITRAAGDTFGEGAVLEEVERDHGALASSANLLRLPRAGVATANHDRPSLTMGLRGRLGEAGDGA